MERSNSYTHGYGERESLRLWDQSRTLADLLHSDTCYPPGSRVLEAGCGVGAQTVLLARNSPDCEITAVDINAGSLAAAREAVHESGATNVTFLQADLFALDLRPGDFDHVFLCFVLEHLAEPLTLLKRLVRSLPPSGTLTAIEGDHHSVLMHPPCDASLEAVEALVALQARSGGDALIGRRLYPLLSQAGLSDVRVSPRVAYADAGRPEWVEGFTRNTFAAMVEGVREGVTAAGLIAPDVFECGVRGLHRAAEPPDGTFCYTFFKAVGVRQDEALQEI